MMRPVLRLGLALVLAGSWGCARLPVTRGAPPSRAPGAAVDSPTTHYGSPATATLLREARELEERGEEERAAASLERAIRLAPRDPVAWNRLAELRLRQGQGPLAEQLARKSIQLAGEDSSLLVRNWRLIARSRQLSGDEPGSQIAAQKAAASERSRQP